MFYSNNNIFVIAVGIFDCCVEPELIMAAGAVINNNNYFSDSIMSAEVK